MAFEIARGVAAAAVVGLFGLRNDRGTGGSGARAMAIDILVAIE